MYLQGAVFNVRSEFPHHTGFRIGPAHNEQCMRADPQGHMLEQFARKNTTLFTKAVLFDLTEQPAACK